MNGYFDIDGHPQISVILKGLTNQPLSVPCLIDSGFDGFLVLPQSTAIRLGLPLFGTTYVELADGSKRNELLYLCGVSFGDEERMIPVSLSNSSAALLGTKMLDGKRLLINFKNRTVKITPLIKVKENLSDQLKLLKKQVKSSQ